MICTRIIEFFLERGRFGVAINLMVIWRRHLPARLWASIMAPKIAASVFAGMIGVMGASEIIASLLAFSRALGGAFGLAIASIGIVLSYFVLLDYGNLRPRPSFWSSIGRGSVATILALAYAILFTLGANASGVLATLANGLAGFGIASVAESDLCVVFAVGSMLLGTFLSVFWDRTTATKPI